MSQKHGILERKGLERWVTQPLHFAEVETELRRGKIMERYTGQGQAGPRSSRVEPTEIFPSLRNSLELNGDQPLLLLEWKLMRAWVLPGLLIAESAAPGPGLTQSKCPHYIVVDQMKLIALLDHILNQRGLNKCGFAVPSAKKRSSLGFECGPEGAHS